MKRRLSLFSILALSLLSQANAASLLDQFQPGLGLLVAIGINPITGDLIIYPDFDASMYLFDQSGVLLGSVPRPGNSANDYDIDYSLGPMNIGGTAVAANTLLVFNGDDNPDVLYALDADGNILATLALTMTSLVGGAHIPGTSQIVTVDWTGLDFIRIINAEDGTEAGSFNAGPPPFDIYYGDIDLSAVTGEITIVSSSQNIVRQITQQGFCVRELDVGPFGISGMSGVAIDDTSGNLWISSTNGSIYRLDPRPALGDSDGDGLADYDDNCTELANPGQQDSDNDGIGNACDADLSNDCFVNFTDLTGFRAAFFSTPASPQWNPDADLTGVGNAPDGIVNFLDLNRVRDQFFGPPGPSGRGNLCGCGL